MRARHVAQRSRVQREAVVELQQPSGNDRGVDVVRCLHDIGRRGPLLRHSTCRARRRGCLRRHGQRQDERRVADQYVAHDPTPVRGPLAIPCTSIQSPGARHRDQAARRHVSSALTRHVRPQINSSRVGAPLGALPPRAAISRHRMASTVRVDAARLDDVLLNDRLDVDGRGTGHGVNTVFRGAFGPRSGNRSGIGRNLGQPASGPCLPTMIRRQRRGGHCLARCAAG